MLRETDRKIVRTLLNGKSEIRDDVIALGRSTLEYKPCSISLRATATNETEIGPHRQRWTLYIMPLKLLARILLVYSLGLLFSYLNILVFSGRDGVVNFYKTSTFWLPPFVCIVCGLGIGGLVLMLSKIKDRVKFLFYSALGGCLLFFVIIASFRSISWYHSRFLANVDSNEEFINSNTPYPLQEKQALKMLTDKYESPNNLRISQKSTSKYDSIVNDAKVQAYTVEFIYVKRNMKGYYKSKCIIIGNEGSFQYFDRKLNDLEQQSIDSSNNEGLRKALKTILENSERLSLDSTTKATIQDKIKSKKIVLDTLSYFSQ